MSKAKNTRSSGKNVEQNSPENLISSPNAEPNVNSTDKNGDQSFENFVRSSLSSLQHTLDTVARHQIDFNERLTTVERKQNDIVKHLELSDGKNSDICEIVKDTLTPRVKQLQGSVDKLEEENYFLRNKLLDQERYSRGYNLRMGGVKEDPGENPIEIVNKYIHMELNMPDVKIENAHRVGRQKDGQTRHIIMKFIYRPERRAVLQKSRALQKEMSTNTYLVEDLVVEDKRQKDKFRDLMSKSYKEGKKVRFTRDLEQFGMKMNAQKLENSPLFDSPPGTITEYDFSNDDVTSQQSSFLRRRYDVIDLGDPLYFQGWADVQGFGAANDYCRVIGKKKRRFLSCAMAGSTGQDHTYVSRMGMDLGYNNTWFMRDLDGDGKDDYCRCIGNSPETKISCVKAGDLGFYGGPLESGDEYSFDVPPSNNCHDKPLNPYHGV